MTQSKEPGKTSVPATKTDKGRNKVTSEKTFFVAFGASIGLHLVILVIPLLSLPWLRVPRQRGPLDVVYEYEIAKRELRHLQQHLARTRQVAEAPSPTQSAGRGQIRIPERPVLATTRALPEIIAHHSSVVDLTDLSEASRGDPVLLSYFSALRQQIQRTANQGGWLTSEAEEGLVYVSFVLTAGGRIRRAAVIRDRSTSAPALQEIALRIVKAAAPFPAFPPSFGEANKTIIVPLEFLFGS